MSYNVDWSTTWTEVWTNNAIGNEFGSQSVVFSTNTSFNEYVIVFTRDTSFSMDYPRVFVKYAPLPMRNTTLTDTVVGVDPALRTTARFFSIASRSVSFSVGYKSTSYGSASPDNSVLIPYKIYAR